MILAQQLPAIARVTVLYDRVTTGFQRYAAPVYDLAVRVWMAQVFFMSGRTKIADWDTTVYLFEEEYKVPVLPPEIAAYIGTTFELLMPVFLVVGLFSRAAALPLIGMACVIQFVLGSANPDYDSVEHIYWLFLLVGIVIRGPGPLSLDHLIRTRVFGGV